MLANLQRSWAKLYGASDKKIPRGISVKDRRPDTVADRKRTGMEEKNWYRYILKRNNEILYFLIFKRARFWYFRCCRAADETYKNK